MFRDPHVGTHECPSMVSVVHCDSLCGFHHQNIIKQLSKYAF